MWFLQRKGSSGFSASSTAEEVTHGIDGTGLTAIVTGASSGLGTETTRVLALHGVHVIMAIRNLDAGRKVKNSIVEEIPAAKIDIMELDLNSMASVRKFASEFKSSGLPLNILINNAGVMVPNFALSQDNIEVHFAINHLGHFLLTNLLLDVMKNTAIQSQIQGRIVIVTSDVHRLIYKRIQFDKIDEDTWYKYGVSKLANLLHANELSRQLKEEGALVTVNSVHPGVILTNIQRQYGFLSGIFNMIGKFFLKDIPQGAATTCYIALHPQVKDVSGEYFADCKISKPGSQAKDAELAKELWNISLNFTNSK